MYVKFINTCKTKCTLPTLTDKHLHKNKENNNIHYFKINGYFSYLKIENCHTKTSLVEKKITK